MSAKSLCRVQQDRVMTGQLTHYETARTALRQAAEIDECKDIADKAKAIEQYAKQHQNADLERYAAEIKARAARRIGELSRELDAVSREERGKMAHGALPGAGTCSKTATLKAAGLSTSVANRFEAIADLPEEEFEGYIREKAKQNKPVKITEVEAKALASRREKKQKEALQANPPVTPEGLFVGDFREFASTIPDGSIELIFTDPPYDRASIPLFEDLALHAKRVLRPGGSLIAYCGQIQLPSVLGMMSKHLRYLWVNACVLSPPKNQMRKLGIVNGWKPMVWFGNGSRGDVQTFVEDTISGPKEKSHHKWQQSQNEAEYYIDRLCSRNGIVWEPFAGGGTTIAACKALNRKWIACEIDEMSAASISQRLAE